VRERIAAQEIDRGARDVRLRKLFFAPDDDRIRELGLTPVRAQVISETLTVRHDPEKLGNVVLAMIDKTIAQRASFVKPAESYISKGASA